MMTYQGRDDKCSIVHDGMGGKLLYGTMKKLIDPECHRVDQDENGQLDADQNRESMLWKNMST